MPAYTARRKKVIAKSKGGGFDETSMALTQNQSGVMLEKLCNERKVGVDGIIHWKNAT
ncbi:MAG: hypothetical protein ABR911_12490 [Syntrophales bacterium]|jgi:hypothetical protein